MKAYLCFETTKLLMVKSCDNLEAALIPLRYDLEQTTITPQLVKNNFKRLFVNLNTEIIEEHAPLPTASRKQKRVRLYKQLLKNIHKKPWIITV